MKLEESEQFVLAQKLHNKRKLLLEELESGQESIVRDLVVLQDKKVRDKESLIKAIASLENHSNQLIDNLKRWQEKQENQMRILKEIEDQNQQLMLRQGQQMTLRKEMVLKSIELLVEEGLIETSQTERSRLIQLLETKKISREDRKSVV